MKLLIVLLLASEILSIKVTEADECPYGVCTIDAERDKYSVLMKSSNIVTQKTAVDTTKNNRIRLEGQMWWDNFGSSAIVSLNNSSSAQVVTDCKTFITNAHSVYNQKLTKRVDSFSFYLGAHAGRTATEINLQLKTANGVPLLSLIDGFGNLTTWQRRSDTFTDRDFIIIRMREPIKGCTPTLPLQPKVYDHQTDHKITVLSLQSDLPPGVYRSDGEVVQSPTNSSHSIQTISKSNQIGLLFHTGSTTSGSSGGAVVLQNNYRVMVGLNKSTTSNSYYVPTEKLEKAPNIAIPFLEGGALYESLKKALNKQ